MSSGSESSESSAAYCTADGILWTNNKVWGGCWGLRGTDNLPRHTRLSVVRCFWRDLTASKREVRKKVSKKDGSNPSDVSLCAVCCV